MRIEVEAKLILTAIEPTENEEAADIVLAAEMRINDQVGVFGMLGTDTQVGVRIHAGEYKVL